jgi:hypothetical protein
MNLHPIPRALQYIKLMEDFLSGELSPENFERQFLSWFKQENEQMPDAIYDLLSDTFVAVDAYCETPDGPYDLDLKELRVRIRAIATQLRDVI